MKERFKDIRHIFILCLTLGILSFLIDRYIPINLPSMNWHESLSKEVKISGLESIKSDGYEFYYDTEDSKSQIEEVKSYIEENDDNVFELLNIEVSEKPSIIITERFRDENATEDMLGYIQEDKVINILNDKEINEEAGTSVKETALHEYTHWLTIMKGDKLGYNSLELPSWFVEGLAYYMEFKCSNVEIPDDGYDIVSLSDQKEEFSAYAIDQSVIFINYLVKNYGNESIDKILYECKNEYLEDAIKKVTNKDIDEICKILYDSEY